MLIVMAKDNLILKLVQLQEKIDFYKQVMDKIPALVLINSFAEKGNFNSLVNVWSNRFSETITGYSRHEIGLLGYGFFTRIVHPDDLELMKSGWIPETASPQTEFFLMYRLKPKDQTDYHWMYSIGIPLEIHADGSAKTTLQVIVDLTGQMDSGSPLVLALKKAGRLKNKGRYPELTKRERDVLQNIVAGLTDHEIGVKFFISAATAKTHRNKILKKLGLKNTASLVAFAIECGLV